VGYAPLAASSVVLWRQLGVYAALMMATSALTTLALLPALVLLGDPRFLRKTRGPEPGALAAA
jgi:predicted RND superfamily exporter protein